MELRRFEEEATLAELEWKIEMDNLTESKLSPVVSSALNTSTFNVNKQPHSTPATSEMLLEMGLTVNRVPCIRYPMEHLNQRSQIIQQFQERQTLC